MPLKHVDAFADALGLAGAERETFVLEEHLTHSSPLIREEFRRMRGNDRTAKGSAKAKRARPKA